MAQITTVAADRRGLERSYFQSVSLTQHLEIVLGLAFVIMIVESVGWSARYDLGRTCRQRTDSCPKVLLFLQ